MTERNNEILLAKVVPYKKALQLYRTCSAHLRDVDTQRATRISFISTCKNCQLRTETVLFCFVFFGGGRLRAGIMDSSQFDIEPSWRNIQATLINSRVVGDNGQISKDLILLFNVHCIHARFPLKQRSGFEDQTMSAILKACYGIKIIPLVLLTRFFV